MAFDLDQALQNIVELNKKVKELQVQLKVVHAVQLGASKKRASEATEPRTKRAKVLLPLDTNHHNFLHTHNCCFDCSQAYIDKEWTADDITVISSRPATLQLQKDHNLNMGDESLLRSSVQLRRWAKLVRPLSDGWKGRDLSFLVEYHTVPRTAPKWYHVSDFVDLTAKGSVSKVTEQVANYCHEQGIKINTLNKPCQE